MAGKADLVLIPGLLCSPALRAAQISTLSDVADISAGDHTRHASMPAIASAIRAAAPAGFALAGLSMGGYIACEIMRQAGDRVTRLALLDTGARVDPPERRQGRLQLVSLAEQEGAARAQRQLLPMLIHPAAADGGSPGHQHHANGDRHRGRGLQTAADGHHGSP